ncbi:peptide ligase PGM1-related protein [Microbacterium ureisolvens]|uniref:peptide ligase PGM1-related protein n=1 Tax=Microbacterium ureisolvens TaxID=2781186 RepID=UPI0036340B5F
MTLTATAPVTLSSLTDAERDERFDRLQERMPPVWASMQQNLEDESVVVVPSLTVGSRATSAAMVQAYEERFLFLLLLLRQPMLRMTYVTSQPIDPRIIEYYLALLPGVIPSHALARLTLISVGDGTHRTLSEKILERPHVLARIARSIPDRERCHLIPYNTTPSERDLALELGIPMFGADHRLAALGTKTGCRRLFRDVGVQHPLGIEDLRSRDDAVRAIETVLDQKPGVQQMIFKLDEGVSGSGNALVDLAGVGALSGEARRAAIADRLDRMQPEVEALSPADMLEALATRHGIIEERIVGEEILSPSVQLRVLPDRTIELLSTHDQLLGGRSGQSYLGCVFPADPAYSRLISEPALAVARRLADLGVRGRFALDFVVVRDAAGQWSPWAIELNLRKGGTTHPFLTLQFLTGGRYDGEEGAFLTPEGARKHLVATDHLEDDDLRALSVGDLFDAVARHDLHFDRSRQEGIVFHMISSITERGRIGMTAVGDTPERAMELYERGGRILLEEARRARAEQPLPD